MTIFPKYSVKMLNTLFVKGYTDIPYDKSEILRYCGVKKGNAETEKLLEECLFECDGIFSYKVCHMTVPVTLAENVIDFGFAKAESAALSKNLSECTEAIFFAATTGLNIDRLILKYSRVNAAKALVFQAIGAERIEALCNAFCDDLQAELASQGLYLRPRFSPGYGDFSIEFQKDLFAVLDCNRKIGLSLNESLIMSPSKSVTAVVGISGEKCRKRDESCMYCEMKNCSFRRKKIL